MTIDSVLAPSSTATRIVVTLAIWDRQLQAWSRIGDSKRRPLHRVTGWRPAWGNSAMIRAVGGLIQLLLILLLPSVAISQPLLQPPVMPACVSSPFGWRQAVGPHAPAGFHNGIDLPAPAGALVHAAAAGTIEMVKRQGLGGVTVHLRHPGGLVTLYAHLGNLVPAIAEGRRNVAAGEVLGHVARTGVTYGTHVFFAVLENGQAVDPLGMLPPLPRC
jgi:murein DD-endopeptidase MepM/ murein hydrolase activator NlpD